MLSFLPSLDSEVDKIDKKKTEFINMSSDDQARSPSIALYASLRGVVNAPPSLSGLTQRPLLPGINSIREYELRSSVESPTTIALLAALNHGRQSVTPDSSLGSHPRVETPSDNSVSDLQFGVFNELPRIDPTIQAISALSDVSRHFDNAISPHYVSHLPLPDYGIQLFLHQSALNRRQRSIDPDVLSRRVDILRSIQAAPVDHILSVLIAVLDNRLDVLIRYVYTVTPSTRTPPTHRTPHYQITVHYQHVKK